MEINKGSQLILTNCGRRPIYVDSQPLLTNKSLLLHHNQLIEVSYNQSFNLYCNLVSFRYAQCHS